MLAESAHSDLNEAQRFLDDVFERAVRLVEDGVAPEVDALIDGHDALRAEVERLIWLAQHVAMAPGSRLPAFAGFTVLQELGRGGMGAVYLARQESLGGRPVALKVLPQSAGLSSRARDRFLVEARAIAKLRHPNVVAVHDVVQQDGVCAYAMEWVDGTSLASLIDFLTAQFTAGGTRTRDGATMEHIRAGLGNEAGLNEASPVVFFVRIGLAMARALAVVHKAGLLHRDVKPSNILLRRDGTPLLADFGLVKDADSSLHTQAGQFAGTVAYAPPEQLRGETEAIDARSDVYALGVTLYHALALKLPFEAREPAGMLRRIEFGAALPLRAVNPRVPRDLETIVAAAMEADPARRYQSADEMADDLERLLSFQPIRARPSD
ncbi:MAG TPA: serine/threonine-protein kinase [Phycisphaerae bacterium]|nr:serine/threonine-protein kinase [Phycisphaerae bacterium]